MDNREEFLEMVEQHRRDLPTAQKDELALASWVARTNLILEQFSRDMREQLSKDGGTFGERVRMLVHSLIPASESRKKEAVLALGVKVLGYTVSEVTDQGAIVDLRLKTGV